MIRRLLLLFSLMLLAFKNDVERRWDGISARANAVKSGFQDVQAGLGRPLRVTGGIGVSPGACRRKFTSRSW